MTPEIALTLAIVTAALLLFMWNRLRADVVALIVMAILIVSGLVSLREGVSGFANEATLTVAAMFVLSAGLLRTGGIELLGRWIARLGGGSELRLVAVTVAVVLVASAFVNNTPVVVVMVPVALGVARTMKASPSRVLMPLSFGSQLGGTLTLVGTSTNLLVAGLIVELGLPALGLFDITPPGLVMATIGVVYILTVGRWLTPVREGNSDLLASYELRDYLSTLIVQPESPLVGRSLGDTKFGSQSGLQILRVDRGPERIESPRADTVILADDMLLVRGKTRDLTSVLEAAHLVLAAQPRLPADNNMARSLHLAEMIVLPRSAIEGLTLRTSRMRTTHGIAVLGIQRHGDVVNEQLADLRLTAGDVLLVQGTSDQLMQLHEAGMLALIGAVDLPARRTSRLPVAVGIMLSVVLLAAFGVFPILLSALLGVVAMFLTGCLTPDEAYKEVDWMVLVLLGALIPLGIAMQKSGTAAFVAEGIVSAAEPLGPHGVVFAIYLLTSVLTEAISNNAAALVLTPIAIATAAELGISPLPLVIAVMFAASNSFMTPIGYQTNTFIFGPGGYRFGDFMRVGGPLNLIMVVAATFVIPYFFPF